MPQEISPRNTKRGLIKIEDSVGTRAGETIWFISETDPYVWHSMPPEEVSKEEEKHIDRVMADLIPLIRMQVAKVLFSND